MTQNTGGMPELLPCPWCGSTNWELSQHPLRQTRSVRCGRCDTEGPTAFDANGAIQAWNTRHFGRPIHEIGASIAEDAPQESAAKPHNSSE